MKIGIVSFLLLISQLLLAQANSYRGTIKIKKDLDDSSCTATILGYKGEKFLKKSELSGIKRIELNEDCNYKIVSFLISYISYDETHKYTSYNEDIPSEVLINALEGNVLKFSRITAKSKTSDKEITFPPIIFKIID